MVRVSDDRPRIDLPFTAHFDPLTLERITMRTHGSRQPAKLLALFATLHQQFVATATIPELLGIKVRDWTGEVDCLCHAFFSFFFSCRFFISRDTRYTPGQTLRAPRYLS